MDAPQNPLTEPTPAQIHLADSPLIRVIAQVRFPVLAAIEQMASISSFQEAIQQNYPILRPQTTSSFQAGPSGTYTWNAWRFFNVEKNVQVTLGPNFLALETINYKSREDFLARLQEILSALGAHIKPAAIDRLGLRYIDQISGENLKDLPLLVRPEVSGVLSTAFAQSAEYAISEHLFHLPEQQAQLRARWGQISPGQTIDPFVIEPVSERTWLLDMDASQGDLGALEVERLVERAHYFAERIYSLFRWVVTDEFLRRYGASL